LVKDKELVERALKSLGKEGQDALGRIENAADRSSVSLHALSAAASGVNRGMDRLKTGVALAAAGLATGFVLGIRGAIQRLEEMDKLSAQVDRALSNTGNTAKTSAAELAAFADELELRTGRAAEEIMAIGGNLATFKFDNEVFYRSIELANDMSAAWGGELRQNLEGLARALADPEKGFAMLEKRGISLTDVQGDLVKRFMAVNDIASAQRVILDALEADVKGVAEEGMTPLEKATLAAEKAMENLFEDLVKGEGGGDDLRQSMIRLAEVLSDPNVLQAVRMFGNTLVASLRMALEFIGGVSAGLQRLIDFFSELEGKSVAGLTETRYNINRQIVELDADRLKIAREQQAAGGTNNMIFVDRLAQVDRDLAALRAEEAAITQMLDARKAAANLTAPLPTVTRPGSGSVDDGDLPPPVLTPEQSRAQSQALREAARLTEQVRTATEDYAARLAELDDMLARGLITQETHGRATAKAALEYAGAADGTEEYRAAQLALQRALAAGIVSEAEYTKALEDLTQRRLSASTDWLAGVERGLRAMAQESDIGKTIEDSLVSAASSFEDALMDAFETGKLEWDDFSKQIMSDLLRMGVRQGISGLSSIINTFFSGAGYPTNPAALRLGYQAGVGHSGATIGSSPANRLLPAEMFFQVPRFHTGTDFLKPGEVPFIGMQGEEIGWPEQLRRKYGGKTDVTIQHRTEVHNYGSEQVRTEQARGADGVDVTKVIIGTVNSGLAEGRFDGIMDGVFGVKRKGR
jgi:hypothetical protein